MNINKEYEIFDYAHITETDIKNPDERHALAYTDIHGHPVDKDEDGGVICRIWLLRKPVNNMKRKSYIVDWHQDAYRNDEIVLELIKQAKDELDGYAENIIEGLFQKAYERYKLEWMLSHACTLDDLVKKLQIQMIYGAENVKEAYGQMQEDAGFDGELWACEDEFRSHEWIHKDYMKDLLTDDEYAVWNSL